MGYVHILKQSALIGLIAVSLSACGGGGGGGESSSGSSNNNNSTDNTVQQETFSAPERLSSGMEFTMTSTETGKVSKFIITSPTGFADETGANASMEYTKTGDKTCSISYKYDSSPFVTLARKFVFTSATGGDYYHGDKKMGTFTFASSSGNDSSSDGESNDDTTADDSTQLVPESLPVGTVINLHANSGSISSYTLNSDSNCTSNSGAKLTWEYSVTGDNTAEWVAHNALNIPLTYKLVFTSATGGTYTYVNAGGEASVSGSFNLSDKSDAPTQEENDNSTTDDNDAADDGGGDEEEAEGDAPKSIAMTSCSVTSGLRRLELFFLSETEVSVVSYYDSTFGSNSPKWKKYEESVGSYKYSKSKTNENCGNLTIMANSLYHTQASHGSSIWDFLEFGMTKYTIRVVFSAESDWAIGFVEEMSVPNTSWNANWTFDNWDF